MFRVWKRQDHLGKFPAETHYLSLANWLLKIKVKVKTKRISQSNKCSIDLQAKFMGPAVAILQK